MLWARHPTDAGTPDGVDLPTRKNHLKCSGDCHPGPTAFLSGVLPPLPGSTSLGFCLGPCRTPVQEQPSSAPLLKARKRDRARAHTLLPAWNQSQRRGIWGAGPERLLTCSVASALALRPSSETMVTARFSPGSPFTSQGVMCG